MPASFPELRSNWKRERKLANGWKKTKTGPTTSFPTIIWAPTTLISDNSLETHDCLWSWSWSWGFPGKSCQSLIKVCAQMVETKEVLDGVVSSFSTINEGLSASVCPARTWISIPVQPHELAKDWNWETKAAECNFLSYLSQRRVEITFMISFLSLLCFKSFTTSAREGLRNPWKGRRAGLRLHHSRVFSLSR